MSNKVIPSRGIPVLMYHSVGQPKQDWIWSYLTIPYNIFENQIRYLKKMGFNAITLKELYEYVKYGLKLPYNPMVLTFDDGYLDNWVYAYPILKKYGFKGTIFINPDFIDPYPECRPTIEDVWNRKRRINELIQHGFLSWPEMKKMEQEGVIDIQSHAITHTWYFKGPGVVDFRHPHDQYVWMDWNDHPSTKYSYITNRQQENIKYGTPVYEYEKSLAARRYFPDRALEDQLVRYVDHNGGIKFFKKDNWKQLLYELVEKYKKENTEHGYYETNEEYKSRIEHELKNSREIIEQNLNKQVEFLCWPGGGYTEESVEIAKKYYLAITLSSRDQTEKKNIFGEDPTLIKRMGIPHISPKNDLNKIKYLRGLYLFYEIRSYQGSKIYNYLRKYMKLYYLIRFDFNQ